MYPIIYTYPTGCKTATRERMKGMGENGREGGREEGKAEQELSVSFPIFENPPFPNCPTPLVLFSMFLNTVCLIKPRRLYDRTKYLEDPNRFKLSSSDAMALRLTWNAFIAGRWRERESWEVGGRERGREGERDGGRKRGREGGRKDIMVLRLTWNAFISGRWDGEGEGEREGMREREWRKGEERQREREEERVRNEGRDEEREGGEGERI